MIQRPYYLDQIRARMWDGNIKVITGIRRGGKSTLLFTLFKEYLLSSGVTEDHILEIALDRRRFFQFRDPVYLCDYVQQIVENDKEGKYYLFIDEVQLTVPAKDRVSGIEVTIYDMLSELRAYPNLDCAGPVRSGCIRFPLPSFIRSEEALRARRWMNICCTGVCPG